MFDIRSLINVVPTTPAKERSKPANAAKRTGSARVVPSPAKAVRGTRIREVPAVRRAALILGRLATSQSGMTVSVLARDLDIIPSTCLHILRELAAAHLVAFEPNGKTYRLGLGLLSLTMGLRTQDAYILAAEQRLVRFAQENGISVSAQERDGKDAVVVSVVTAGEGFEAPLGKRVALFSAAGGRLFAGHVDWPRAEMQKQFSRVPWQEPPAFEEWLKEVELARSRGYAIDEGRFRLGVTSIAAGVPGKDGSVRRAISINVVSAQLDPKRVSVLVHALRVTAASIADML